jgi:threonyl-tRNA synthetase
MVNVTLPDGCRQTFADGATVRDVAERIGPGLAKAAIAGKVNGRLVDLSFEVVPGAGAEDYFGCD